VNTEGVYRFNLDWMLWLFLVQNFSVLQFSCGTCAGFVATNLIGRKEVYRKYFAWKLLDGTSASLGWYVVIGTKKKKEGGDK